MHSFGRTIPKPTATRGGRAATGSLSIAALALLVLTLFVATAAATPKRAATNHSEMQRALDQVVAAGVPGAVLLAQRGSHTTLLASGFGNLKQKTQTRTGDRFRVGSVTKTFVATLVLQLVEAGKLR